MARVIARIEITRLFTITHPSTIAADNARTRPAPDGRLSMVKVSRLLVAPPVKTQPYVLPPVTIPRRPTA